MTLKEFKMQYALGTLSYKDKLNLSQSSYTCKKILEILSKDNSLSIRYNVTRNSNVPASVLNTLITEYFKISYR